MGNYIAQFYVDVITYPCPNLNIDLANPGYERVKNVFVILKKKCPCLKQNFEFFMT